MLRASFASDIEEGENGAWVQVGCTLQLENQSEKMRRVGFTAAAIGTQLATLLAG
jgi:hypothetical protein